MSGALKYLVAVVWVLAWMEVLQPCLAILDPWSVTVYNNMSTQRLYLRCKSRDDDLGPQDLAPGQSFSWHFRENLDNSTLFWCYMRNDHDHVAMEVFWPESRSFWLAQRCDYQTCVWSARDDGIYIKNVPVNTYEFHNKWESGW